MTLLLPLLIEHYVTTGGAIVIALVTAGFGFLGVLVQANAQKTKQVVREGVTRAASDNTDEHNATNALLRDLGRDVGGLRADLRTLHNRIDALRVDVTRVDERLDRHLDEGRQT